MIEPVSSIGAILSYQASTIAVNIRLHDFPAGSDGRVNVYILLVGSAADSVIEL
jgi:hypothetical protein